MVLGVREELAPRSNNMTYERFSQLWEALVVSRPKGDAAPITNGMTDETALALIEYANGNKAKIQAIREFLAAPAS